MTKERMSRLMEFNYGIGVVTDSGACYFYEAFDSDLRSAAKRVKEQLPDGGYKVFISRAEEVERMIDARDEEAVIYKTDKGDVVAVLDGEAIRFFNNVENAINKLYKAGFIF